MSKRVAYTPKIEAKELFLQIQEGESFLFEYVFESYGPPDGISEEDYIKELREEYFKLKREEARRLLGLNKK